MESQENNLAKQQLYLTRVQQFYQQVKDWLPTDLTTREGPNYTILDSTGEYTATQLSVVQKNGADSEQVLANLLPKTCTVLLAEGWIEMAGPLWEENLLYMRTDGLRIQDRDGHIRPMYEVEREGWYWEDIHRHQPVLITREVFLDLLQEVGDYECK
jgi:hypothetical protein